MKTRLKKKKGWKDYMTNTENTLFEFTITSSNNESDEFTAFDVYSSIRRNVLSNLSMYYDNQSNPELLGQLVALSHEMIEIDREGDISKKTESELLDVIGTYPLTKALLNFYSASLETEQHRYSPTYNEKTNNEIAFLLSYFENKDIKKHIRYAESFCYEKSETKFHYIVKNIFPYFIISYHLKFKKPLPLEINFSDLSQDYCFWTYLHDLSEDFSYAYNFFAMASFSSMNSINSSFIFDFSDEKTSKIRKKIEEQIKEHELIVQEKKEKKSTFHCFLEKEVGFKNDFMLKLASRNKINYAF